MESFEFVSPTKIFFGKDGETRIGEIIASYSFRKILFHYGKKSIKETGLYDRIVSSLKENRIEFVELGGVEANPDVSLCRKGIALCREFQAEMILAVGGGSVIDSAKLIANGVYYSGDPFDLSLHKALSARALPLGVILTNAASGSELSSSCVISSRKDRLKRGFNSDLNRPLFAIENPELTLTLDLYTSGCGAVDIFSHSFERYFNFSERNEFSDYLAEGIMRCTLDNGRLLAENPKDVEVRKNLMLASSYSHNGITSLGKRAKMPIHQLEHELSGLYPNIAHGAGLAALIPSWIEICAEKDRKKFEKFYDEVLRIDDSLAFSERTERASRMMKDFAHLFQIPTALKEYSVSESDIMKMVDSLTAHGTRIFDSRIPLDASLAERIYRNAWED